MSFPKYPTYKPSGTRWLGQVPSHWTTGTLRRFTRGIEQGWSPECLAEPASNGEWGVLKSGCVNGGRFNPDENKALPPELTPVADYEVRPGDLLVSRASGSPELVGAAAYVRSTPPRLMLSDKIFRLTPSAGVSAEYLALLLSCRPMRAQIEAAISGADGLANNLPQSALKAFGCAIPPADEQLAIVVFLDRETAKIDALVAEQERLIGLLSEKRQAVISRAVTKGLNPCAPMTPSGVEWLGDVPSHWSVLAIKRLSPVKRGASPRPIEDPRYFDDEGEFAWVRILDVSASDGVLRTTEQRLSTLGSSLSVKVGAGDLFVSIAGTVGKPCISAIKACIHDGFVYFPGLTVDPRFMYRIFESGLCYGGLGKWGTQLNLNTDTVGAIQVALPPPDELEQILAFIDRESTGIDRLSQEAHRVIELLQTRRTALVSAAVTGQIDVRSSAEAPAA